MNADDQQVAVAAHEHEAGVLVPAPAMTTAALPEETAWSMIYMEGGALALVLAIACTVLWRLTSRVFAESRAQGKELITAQAQALQRLSEAVIKVESAIRISDVNNQAAVNRLADTVAQAIARLDRHEARIDSHTESIMHHSSRISLLESLTRKDE